MKFNRTLRHIIAADDADVMYRRLMDLPGFERSHMDSGYYGSIEITLRDGKRVMEIFRHHRDTRRHDQRCAAITKAAIAAAKYWRNRR